MSRGQTLRSPVGEEVAFKPRRLWGVIRGSPAVVMGSEVRSIDSTQAAACGWVRGHRVRAAEDLRLAGGRQVAWLLDSGAVSVLFLTGLGGPQNAVTRKG